MSERASLPRLISQSLPVIVDLASQIVFWALEIMLVGRLGGAPDLRLPAATTSQGAQAMVAVGAVQLVLLISVTLLLAFVIGSVISINRFLGAGLAREADHYLGQAVLGGLLASLFIGILWYFGSGLLARLIIGGSGGARIMMIQYLRTLAPFTPLLVLNFVLLGILRGTGDARLSMSVNLLLNGLHFGGALLLIFGLAGLPALGVRGSALAGGLAHSVGALLSLALILGGRSRLRLRRSDLTRLVPQTCGRLFRLGLPVSVEQLAMGLGLVYLLGVATRLGTRSAAAHISLLSLQRIASMVFWGLGIAAMSLVGQQHGAGRDDLARDSARRLTRLAFAAAAILAAAFVFFPSPLIRLFTPDVHVVALGGRILALLAIILIPRALAFVSAFALRGIGDTQYPMKLLLLSATLFMLLLAPLLALPLGLGLAGIWLALLGDETLRATLLARRFWRRRSPRALETLSPEQAPLPVAPLAPAPERENAARHVARGA